VEIREGDFYRIRLNDCYRKRVFEPNHCFEGLLMVIKGIDEKLFLQDTFWSHYHNDGWRHSSDSGKRWTLEETLKNGDLIFVCNIEDIEQITKYNTDYYKESDIIKLTSQHGCYTYWFKLKNAEKDRDTILARLVSELENERHKLESALRSIDSLEKKIKGFKDGEINIDDIYL